MAGTKLGGIKASITTKQRHGDQFYKDIGSKGGKIGTTGGFASYQPCICNIIEEEHDKRQCAGKLGGKVSSRKRKNND